MKRVSTGFLAALIAACCGLNALAAPTSAAGTHGSVAQADQGAPPPANFGAPPSGTVPILYNDHHVYTKPDVLKQGRVLAALVKGGTILIPLRSMFEQMGATVSYDAASKTATVSKPGAQVAVTVGKASVTINGEERPLDVPPMIYQGSVLVPVRVISEGMGAYVLWVPDQHVVVVRYIPPTPPPTPAPPPPATPAPTPPPTPAPTPKPVYHDLFLAGDYIISPKVYNEFSPGNTGSASFAARGAYEFDLASLPFMIEGTFERWQYPHNCNGYTPGTTTYEPECYVTGISPPAYSSVVLTSQPPADQDFDVRLGFRVINPRVYIGAAYMFMSNNYGYPNMQGFGFGGEKLPDLDQSLSGFGSIYYYPNIHATYNNGSFNEPLGYNVLKFQIGASYVFRPSPIFLEAGWMGDSWTVKAGAPVNRSYNGPFVGLGIKF